MRRLWGREHAHPRGWRHPHDSEEEAGEVALDVASVLQGGQPDFGDFALEAALFAVPFERCDG